jgi:hypothetical protein
MKLKKYSIGIGDRFGCQGKALLRAIIKAEENGIDLAVVWNKSFREHKIVNTKPSDVLKEAQNAVKELNWKGDYYIDADHINLSNVDFFIDSSNFFTLDVAEYIGKNAPVKFVKEFVQKHKNLIGTINLPVLEKLIYIKKEDIEDYARKYLIAIKEAKKIYNEIEKKKGKGNFIVEISLDESQEAQKPLELLLILNAVVDEKIPIQTIAPKFVGNFNKGIDFKGNISNFAEEFDLILATVQYAKRNFFFLENLKVSIHSGSDKFSLYPIINKAIKKFNTGIHLKTSGTTWLEELLGLAMVGNEGLDIVKEIYEKAYNRIEELCFPYVNVIDINKDMLPTPEILSRWNSEMFLKTLQHNSSCKDFNPNIRQFLHIAYKIAAEMGTRYINALHKYENIIEQNVTENMYERHIKPLFI